MRTRRVVQWSTGGVGSIDDFCRMLTTGINVVTTSVPGLLHPRGFDPAEVGRIEDACRRGEASLYSSGIEPGFAGDHLVLVLTTLSRSIRSVRTQELFSYAGYPVAFTMFEVFGFGKPPDQQCLMELRGVQTSAWGPPVRMVADALGAELDAIIIEHVNRMASDIAPDWPTAIRDGTYRIEVDGEPSLTCELQLGGDDDSSRAGMVATTMRVVNAIPYVCDARPGIVSATDLPLTLPHDAFHRSNR